MILYVMRTLCALASVLLMIGCTPSGATPSKPEKAKPAQSIGGTGNTPTSITHGGTAPAKFWLTYPFEPAGRRDWMKVGKGQWEERWADGTVVKYTEVERYAVGGVEGTIVRKADGSEDVLIPDGGKDEWVRFRAAQGGRNWMYMGQIEGVE